MSNATIPLLETAELLIALDQTQTELQAAKAQLQQLQFEAANAPQTNGDTVAGEIAKAVRVEAQRVNLNGIRAAVHVLESREKQLRDQLTQSQETERAQQAEADVRAAIAQMKKLSAKLDKSTAALMDTINEMKAIEQQHGSSFRRHLAALKRSERPNYEEFFRFPTEQLLKIKDLRLPVLRQDNGIDGDIRWYGDGFVLSSETPNLD